MESSDMTNMTWAFDLAWFGETVLPDGTICEDFPQKMSSSGLWEKMILNKKIGQAFWAYRLPNLEIVILLVFVLWQLFDFLSKKFRLSVPRFTSMMLAGLILAIGVKTTSRKSFFNQIFTSLKSRHEIPETLGTFGFTMFWFLKGVKMDLKRIFRSERKAMVTGIAAVILPMLAGVVVYMLHEDDKRVLKAKEYEIMVIIQSISAFSGIAKLLRDLKINHSELGRIALSTSLVSELVGLCINYLTIPLMAGFKPLVKVQMTAVVVFIFLAFKVVRPMMFRVIKRKREGRPIDDKYIYAILVLVCFSFLFFDFVRQYPPFGPFILGLAIPNGPPLGSALVERLEGFNHGIVLPLFLSLTMLKIDLPWLLKDLEKLFNLEGHSYAAICFISLMFLVKFSTSLVIPYVYKVPLKDSLVLSLIMSHKGIVELAFYLFSFEDGNLTQRTFSILAISILLNSIFIPITIAYLYDPSKQFVCYEKRSLVHLKTSSELKTLVCIHRPDHITSMINILEASSQSEERLLACYVLHLVELSGQATPTIISHKVQKLGVGNGQSCSENVILSFEHFHRYVCSSVSIDTFTSISVPSHMQDDICWLALDKAVTLILLPFHRTWSLDRTTIVSDNEMIRYLNYNVLKQAPCSVGILVDRQSTRERQKSRGPGLKVCVVFVGGRDDREALALAKQMARNANVRLTVLRLIPSGKNKESMGWDQMLDSEDLKEFMRSKDSVRREDSSSAYIEEEVQDGTDTSMLLRSMASDYDLFLVGRSNGVNNEVISGLENWSEFEELGVLGDFLASADFPSKASVLVIQQQRNLA